MSSIRQMTLKDLADVAELDALAFNAKPRTYSHLKACLNLNPRGCFVATATDGRLVGYVFSRMWGRLGWIGVGGVRPDQQRKGFGTALVSRAIKHLRDSGCETIGISTAAEKPDNVGLYTRLGFLPGPPTLELTKTTERPRECLPFAFLSNLGRDMTLEAVRQLSQQVMSGLDYRSEVRNACDYRWGETLLFGWPQPWAFAIVRTDPIREDSTQKMGIAVLAMPRYARKRLPEVLRAIEGLAGNRNYAQVCLAVNASDPDALQQALMYGFCVSHLRIRMTLEYPPEPPTGVDLSRWAM